MRSLIILGLLFMVFPVHAITPSKLNNNGGITFAISTVNGYPAYTQTEKDELISMYGSGNVVDYTPSFYELAVATTSAALPNEFGKFDSYSAFADLLTSKTEIERKFLEHEKTLLAYEDAYADHPMVNLQPRINKMKAIINLLYAVYFSLP